VVAWLTGLRTRWYERTKGECILELCNLSAGEHRLSVRVRREHRPFRVRVPKEQKRRSAVVALDGVTLLNQEGNMGSVNGVDEASERHGFVAIHPIPRTRHLGIVAGWNT